MTAPDLSVIITTHNRADDVAEALASLSTQVWATGSWDVIVVDNASTDETPAVLREWQGRLPVDCTIVHANEGRGPSYARNTGVRHSSARSVAFVDDDDLVAPGWVAAIGTALEEEALVGSRFDHHRLNPAALADHTMVQVDRLGDAYGASAASGGGLGCRRELWERLGGSDESLRYGEDIDFSLRAAALGAPAGFCADAIYQPRLSDGVRAAFRRGWAHGRASVGLFVRHGRANGATPDPASLLVRVWVGFVVRLPSLRDEPRRLVYSEQLGRRLGRLNESARRRVWYP